MRNLYPIVMLGVVLLAFFALFAGCSDDDNPVTDTNHSPVITSLTASQDTVDLADTCTITCSASDTDGDVLTYTWSPEAGAINGTGSSVIWTSPNVSGASTIVCEVSDSHGAAVTDSVHVTVRPAPSWQIVFEDNFDGDTLDTGNWTQIAETPPPYSLTGSGELQIDGELSGDGALFLYNTAISGNYVRVTAKFRTTQNDPVLDDVDMGVCLNVDLTYENLYYLSLTSDPFEATRDYELKIVKLTNGLHTVLRAESMGGTMPQISADNDYILEGVNSNGSITFTVKDESGVVLKSVSVEDSSYSGGKIAIAGDANIGTAAPQSVFFDYAIVEEYR